MKLETKNTTVLITGASSGMGNEIAKRLAADARQIILVARNSQKLDELTSELNIINPALEVHIKLCDLADKNKLAALIITIKQEQSKQQLGDIDILINAAGIAQIGFLKETDFHDIENVIKINVLALSALTHAFLPTMIKNNRGGILNFSSFFGLKILPAYAAYAGSKHFVTGFSDTLRAETTGTNVVISTVYPGPVHSHFWNVDNADIYRPPGFLFISLKQCVTQTLKGFKRGKARIIPGFRIKLLVAFLNASPELIVRLVNAGISRFMQSKRKKSLQTQVSSTTV
jgi:short-subunit dehydrogenase